MRAAAAGVSGSLIWRASPSGCSPLARHPGGHRHDAFLGGVAAGEFTHQCAVAHDQDPVAHAENLRELGRDEQDRQPVTRQPVDDRVYFRLGPDVDPAARFIENYLFWRNYDSVVDDYFLLFVSVECVDLHIYLSLYDG